MDTSTNSWRELVAQKEREWKEVTEQRIQSLEAAYAEKEKCLSEEITKFKKLKEDFKYNLKLLEERDQELERYDCATVDIRSKLNAKNAEVSELKIQMDDLKLAINREVKAREELQIHYQQRLREKQSEIDSFKCTKDAEVNEERKEFETFKRNLQRQVTEVEEELDVQKRELTMGFEDAMKRREHEFRLQADEMSTKVLEYELKAKLLAKELDLMKAAQDKNAEDFEQVDNNHRELEKKLKHKDWELSDLQATKDATIVDLESKRQQSEVAMKRMQEDFQRKHAEMDRYGREKESALSKVKEAYAEREQSLQATIRDLQSQLEDSQVEIRRLEWSNQDLQKEKDMQVEKLQVELQQLREKWDHQLSDVSRSQVSKDLELQALREGEQKLKGEIVQKKEDIERYKKELNLSVEREASLERSKAQLELDWERRFEDVERLQYEKSEELIKKLTRSRDEATAAVKEKDRELQQRETLILALRKDRELAFATLKKHGITLDKNINIELPKNVSGQELDDMSMLREQNENLKTVVREMRHQMELLGQEVPASSKETRLSKGDNITDDYVRSLEKEVRELRQRNRGMEQDLEVARKYGKVPAVQPTTNEEAVMSEVKDNVMVRSHIQSLNDMIGALRGEKLELSAQVKKQQARIQYFDNKMDHLSKQPREKQVEVDQLQYELGAQNRRYQAEVASLRQRVSEFEVQLAESRKEADEYYRSNLERNMEVTSLGQEISDLKMQLAEKRPALNFGAQELVIQQLQDEIFQLQQKSGGGKGGHVTMNKPMMYRDQSGGQSMEELKQKLRAMAKHIAQVTKEKEQLIAVGNRLRAELKKQGVNPQLAPARVFPVQPDSQHIHANQSSQPLSDQFLGRLNQLEKLQYQLSRQELQYAQKFANKSGNAVVSEDWEGNDGNRGGRNRLRFSDDLSEKPDHIHDDINRSTDIDVHASQSTMGEVQTARSGNSAYRDQLMPPGSPRRGEQLLMSLSSVGGESLQEIWKMLDERPSPTPRYGDQSGDRQSIIRTPERPSSSGELILSGKKAELESRPKSERNVSGKASKKAVKNPQMRQLSKVRNYNTRDDNSFR